MKKKLIVTTLLSISVLFSTHAFADDISVEVNGEKLDTTSIVMNDRTLVPLRAISEALNFDVAWDDNSKGINMFRDGDMYMMWIGRDTAFKLSDYAISKYYDMDTLPVVINDRTMLPLRAIGELLGAEVSWNDTTKTASITLAESVYDNADMAQLLMPYEEALSECYDAYKKYVHGELHSIKADITLASDEVIQVEVYPELAPKTVDNFVNLAESEFYDGLIFHRVVDGFVIQGGGFDSVGNDKKSPSIQGEFIANGFLNLIPHNKGVISMARATTPDSASSQFFITVDDATFLNGEYAAFGKVTNGMAVAERISTVETDEFDKPLKDIVIKSIRIQK